MPTRKSSAFLRFWILAALLALGLAASARAGGDSNERVRQHLREVRCALELQGAQEDLTPALAKVLAQYMMPTGDLAQSMSAHWVKGKYPLRPNEEVEATRTWLELQSEYRRLILRRDMATIASLSRIDRALTAWAGRRDLPGAHEADELAIVVHQQRTLQEGTAAVLRDTPGLSHGARVLLVSPRYNSPQPLLHAEASEVRYSCRGEHDLEASRAQRIHMFGGYSHQCFSRAVGELLQGFLGDDRETLEFVIHARFVYFGLGESLGTVLHPVKGVPDTHGTMIVKWERGILLPESFLVSGLLSFPALALVSREESTVDGRLEQRHVYRIGPKTLIITVVGDQ